MLKAIICDIDGTLANVEHRRHFLDEKNPDWKSFNESMVMDTLNEWCATLLRRMSGRAYKIILVSGHGDDYAAHTEEWLEKNNIDYDYLFMRKAKDFRPDEIVKKEIYQNNIKHNFDVLFVVDDRKKVVDMWRGLGLVCLQCCEGDY